MYCLPVRVQRRCRVRGDVIPRNLGDVRPLRGGNNVCRRRLARSGLRQNGFDVFPAGEVLLCACAASAVSLRKVGVARFRTVCCRTDNSIGDV